MIVVGGGAILGCMIQLWLLSRGSRVSPVFKAVTRAERAAAQDLAEVAQRLFVRAGSTLACCSSLSGSSLLPCDRVGDAPRSAALRAQIAEPGRTVGILRRPSCCNVRWNPPIRERVTRASPDTEQIQRQLTRIPARTGVEVRELNTDIVVAAFPDDYDAGGRGAGPHQRGRCRPRRRRRS